MNAWINWNRDKRHPKRWWDNRPGARAHFRKDSWIRNKCWKYWEEEISTLHNCGSSMAELPDVRSLCCNLNNDFYAAEIWTERAWQILPYWLLTAQNKGYWILHKIWRHIWVQFCSLFFISVWKQSYRRVKSRFFPVLEGGKGKTFVYDTCVYYTWEYVFRIALYTMASRPVPRQGQ
jgi:hypothetical protein